MTGDSPINHVKKEPWLYAGIAACLLVCLPLCAKTLAGDWENHLWMVNYNARYLANHLAFPSTLNTQEIVGMAFPAFYGYLFFPFVSTFSTWLDANITLRVFALITFIAEFALVYTTIVKLTRDKFFGFLVGTCLVWAIYPLTNLFHRGAIPEFFATALLTCASVAWVRAIISETSSALKRWCNAAVLFLCFAAGIHPITALYGCIFFMGFVAITLLLKPQKQLKQILIAFAIPALIGSVCLSPWVISTARYNRQFQIAQSFHVIGFYRMTIDNIGLRLSPVPIPYRFLAHDAEIEHMGTPHLDAEVNVPLLLLLVYLTGSLMGQNRLSFRGRLGVCFMLLMAGLFTWFSVSNGFNKAGYFARSIQFSYRLVTYVNLCLLYGILIACWQQTSNVVSIRRQIVDSKLAYSALAVSGIALAFKLAFTLSLAPISQNFFAAQRSDTELLTLPKSFYGFEGYAMPGLAAPANADEIKSKTALPVAEGKQFGAVGETNLPPSGLTATNVQVFKWNKLTLDGKPIEQKMLKADKTFYALDANRRPAAKLNYELDPPKWWLFLHQLSFPLFFAWIIATIIMAIKALLIPAPSGPTAKIPSTSRQKAPGKLKVRGASKL